MTNREAVIEYALRFVGVPYLYGGNNPLTGWDCSAYICELLKSTGVIPWQVDLNAQGLRETLLKTKHESIFPTCVEGSILFFGKSKTAITHTALALNQKIMLEAGGGDSTTTSVQEAGRRGAFVRIRPIRHDLIDSILPEYG